MALRKEGFWEEHYGTELRNFHEAGDEGEVWFGKGLSRKIASKVVDLIKADSYHLSQETTHILDIGCGNAFIICTLDQKIKENVDAKLLNTFRITGLDYSTNSIELSEKIIASKDIYTKVTFAQCDFLDKKQVVQKTQSAKFDFVIDVGTYDAICLLASGSEQKLQQAQVDYMESLYTVVKKGTIFILASCNHTEEELLQLFELDCPQKYEVTLIGHIETPKLQFGGKEGSQVCCLLLRFI